MEGREVVAITVTFNRINTLTKTIDALTKQTIQIDKIIIVDNCSNEEQKSKLKLIEKEHDNIEVVYLDSNKGGAGGFYHGMKYALEKYDPEWYWIMDDDAYPREECLEKLLESGENIPNVGALCPVVHGIDKMKYQMYHHKFISTYKFNDITAVKDYNDLQNITKIDANAFVGPLFSRKAVKEKGLPNGELFIYGDDTEYTYRISHHFNLYLIKKAIIDHQDIPENNNNIMPEIWWKDYYMIRNRFLFIEEFKESKIRGMFAKTYILIKILKQIFGTLIKRKYCGFKKVRINLMVMAIKDGISGKQGKTINPIEYNRLILEKKNNLNVIAPN